MNHKNGEMARNFFFSFHPPARARFHQPLWPHNGLVYGLAAKRISSTLSHAALRAFFSLLATIVHTVPPTSFFSLTPPSSSSFLCGTFLAPLPRGVFFQVGSLLTPQSYQTTRAQVFHAGLRQVSLVAGWSGLID